MRVGVERDLTAVGGVSVAVARAALITKGLALKTCALTSRCFATTCSSVLYSKFALYGS